MKRMVGAYGAPDIGPDTAVNASPGELYNMKKDWAEQQDRWDSDREPVGELIDMIKKEVEWAQ